MAEASDGDYAAMRAARLMRLESKGTGLQVEDSEMQSLAPGLPHGTPSPSAAARQCHSPSNVREARLARFERGRESPASSKTRAATPDTEASGTPGVLLSRTQSDTSLSARSHCSKNVREARLTRLGSAPSLDSSLGQLPQKQTRKPETETSATFLAFEDRANRQVMRASRLAKLGSESGSPLSRDGPARRMLSEFLNSELGQTGAIDRRHLEHLLCVTADNPLTATELSQLSGLLDSFSSRSGSVNLEQFVTWLYT
eukprot:TRINITY_DN79455_c0_g1_i1.p1 TRINITY_DN79455_c0_g1~~TRINITY_DN79455_c0_g1_i1.p1  ORF type:complete len:257 (-),score=40.35 TRINITY_DN79455_c0_g1_i1:68-838(-)